MRDEDGIRAGLWRGGEHLAKGLGAAVVLVGRHDEPALGEVCRLLDVLEPASTAVS